MTNIANGVFRFQKFPGTWKKPFYHFNTLSMEKSTLPSKSRAYQSIELCCKGKWETQQATEQQAHTTETLIIRLDQRHRCSTLFLDMEKNEHLRHQSCSCRLVANFLKGAGVPQDFMLSPVLYNVYTDDTAIVSHSRLRFGICNKL